MPPEFRHAIEFQPCDYVSNPVMITRHHKMTAISRVTSIDLRGQVAADGIAQNHFADVAGLVDFSRGAAMAPGGKSIVVVGSTSDDGKTSNIALEQAAGAVAIPAADVTYVVTEYGAVNLFGKNVQECTMAMISVAHPDFRERLFEQGRRVGLIGQERKLYESQFGVYPAWLSEVLTIAGQKVTIRPVKTVDDRLIQEHFYDLDEHDIAKRFFGRKHHFYWDEMKDMFIVAYTKNCSIVAYLGDEGYGRIIGIGGYFLEGSGSGEVAYSVARDWQGKGIACRLQQKVVDAAQADGFTGLNTLVLKENFSMLTLFKKLPYQIRTQYEDGILTLKCRFDEPA
jgi:RimJ/RimL family protein N-acetyltransferase